MKSVYTEDGVARWLYSVCERNGRSAGAYPRYSFVWPPHEDQHGFILVMDDGSEWGVTVDKRAALRPHQRDEERYQVDDELRAIVARAEEARIASDPKNNANLPVALTASAADVLYLVGLLSQYRAENERLKEQLGEIPASNMTRIWRDFREVGEER